MRTITKCIEFGFYNRHWTSLQAKVSINHTNSNSTSSSSQDIKNHTNLGKYQLILPNHLSNGNQKQNLEHHLQTFYGVKDDMVMNFKGIKRKVRHKPYQMRIILVGTLQSATGQRQHKKTKMNCILDISLIKLLQSNKWSKGLVKLHVKNTCGTSVWPL